MGAAKPAFGLCKFMETSTSPSCLAFPFKVSSMPRDPLPCFGSFLLRAESEPGENLANAQLDGVPFRFLTQKANDIARREARIALSGGSANSAHRVFFPHHGVLQFDYVVVRPRKGLPITAQVRSSLT